MSLGPPLQDKSSCASQGAAWSVDCPTNLHHLTLRVPVSDTLSHRTRTATAERIAVLRAGSSGRRPIVGWRARRDDDNQHPPLGCRVVPSDDPIGQGWQRQESRAPVETPDPGVATGHRPIETLGACHSSFGYYVTIIDGEHTVVGVVNVPRRSYVGETNPPAGAV